MLSFILVNLIHTSKSFYRVSYIMFSVPNGNPPQIRNETQSTQETENGMFNLRKVDDKTNPIALTYYITGTL